MLGKNNVLTKSCASILAPRLIRQQTAFTLPFLAAIIRAVLLHFRMVNINICTLYLDSSTYTNVINH